MKSAGVCAAVWGAVSGGFPGQTLSNRKQKGEPDHWFTLRQNVRVVLPVKAVSSRSEGLSRKHQEARTIPGDKLKGRHLRRRMVLCPERLRNGWGGVSKGRV